MLSTEIEQGVNMRKEKLTRNTHKVNNFIATRVKKTDRFPRWKTVMQEFDFDEHTTRKIVHELIQADYIKQEGKKWKYLGKASKESLSFSIGNTTMSVGLVSIFTIIIFIVGILTTYLSIKLSYNHLSTIYTKTSSLLLSIAFGLFSVIAFEMIIIFKKRKQYILVIIFSILWIIVAGYSMYCTMVGQYEKKLVNTALVIEENKENTNNTNLLGLWEKEVTEINIEIANLREERNVLMAFLKGYEDSSKQYKDTNYRIYLKNESIKIEGEKRKEIITKIENMLKDNRVSTEKNNKPKSFYLWIASIFTWVDSELFQFFSQLFPAVFIDIIAPLSFALVIFLQEKKRN